MVNAKVSLTIGSISFSSEGNEKWVANQLDKVINKLPQIIQIEMSLGEDQSKPISSDVQGILPGDDSKISLPKFLENHDAKNNQVKKFLATAVWLHTRDKKKLLMGKDVTKALSDAAIKKLKNASQCLKDNVKKGYCEKKDKGFFVTDEGRKIPSK